MRTHQHTYIGKITKLSRQPSPRTTHRDLQCALTVDVQVELELRLARRVLPDTLVAAGVGDVDRRDLQPPPVGQQAHVDLVLRVDAEAVLEPDDARLRHAVDRAVDGERRVEDRGQVGVRRRLFVDARLHCNARSRREGQTRRETTWHHRLNKDDTVREEIMGWLRSQIKSQANQGRYYTRRNHGISEDDTVQYTVRDEIGG